MKSDFFLHIYPDVNSPETICMETFIRNPKQNCFDQKNWETENEKRGDNYIGYLNTYGHLVEPIGEI